MQFNVTPIGRAVPHFSGIQQPVNTTNPDVDKAIKLALLEWNRVYKDHTPITHKAHTLHVGNPVTLVSDTEQADLNRFLSVASSKLYKVKQLSHLFISPAQARETILDTANQSMNELA